MKGGIRNFRPKAKLIALVAGLISVASFHSAIKRAFSQGSTRTRRSSGFVPHQGEREKARRRRQIRDGIIPSHEVYK